MIQLEISKRHPLTQLAKEHVTLITPQQLGIVLSRAGVGKTAMLVQLALFYMMQGKQVIHISLNDPLDKVVLRYEEVFAKIAESLPDYDVHQLTNELLPKRMIMTFSAERFSFSALDERIGDLHHQQIFQPQVILLDRLNLEDDSHNTVAAYKTFVMENNLIGWFAGRTHREDSLTVDTIPLYLQHPLDLCDVAINLIPHDKQVALEVLKGNQILNTAEHLILNPKSMLLKETD